jgi:putative oxidoreductase
MVLGFLFMWHGTQKLFDIPVDFPYELNALSQAAGVIELVGGVLVIIGCITRPVAFICSGTMAVAYWMVHGPNGFFPMVNGGELAALYCFGFLLIAANGSGIWSVDQYVFKNDSEDNS